jgi:hypothetical protein
MGGGYVFVFKVEAVDAFGSKILSTLSQRASICVGESLDAAAGFADGGKANGVAG